MRPNDGQQRRLRLLGECEVNIGPVLLLAAAAAVTLVVALFAGAASAQTARPAQSARPVQSTEPVQPADAGETFDAAMQAYERNHWAAAYARFVQLADGGHAEAARMAMQMWRYGPALYRMSFVATAQQVAHWSRLMMLRA